MMTFGALVRHTDDDQDRHIPVLESKLRLILHIVAAQIEVDEDFYMRHYADVREAVQRGDFGCARDHYIIAGYFENRLPRDIPVDADWYFRKYPDVAEGVRKGRVESAQQHFEKFGFKEGRHPFADWAL